MNTLNIAPRTFFPVFRPDSPGLRRAIGPPRRIRPATPCSISRLSLLSFTRPQFAAGVVLLREITGKILNLFFLYIIYMGLRGRNNLIAERYFFVTTTVVRFLEVFKSDHACKILISNIKFYQSKYKFAILAYVIMPSHFHWILEVNPDLGTISDIMRDLKRNSSKELT